MPRSENPHPSKNEECGTRPHGSRKLSSELVVWYYPPGRHQEDKYRNERLRHPPMRETVRSLRAYFILSGLASLFLSGSALRLSIQRSDPIATVILVVTLGFSVAFLCVGVLLARLLKSSAGRIVTLLYASAGWTLFGFLFAVVLKGFSQVELTSVITPIVTLLIVWYLLRNVQRLAAEAIRTE